MRLVLLAVVLVVTCPDEPLKRSYFAFWVFAIPSLFYLALLCMQKRSASGKAQSPHQRQLLSPTDNTAPALSEMPGLEWRLYFRNLHLYIFIIKYIGSSQSGDMQLLVL